MLITPYHQSRQILEQDKETFRMHLKEYNVLTLCWVMALMHGRLVSSTVTLDQNQYNDLVIAISPDIDEAEGPKLIAQIKDFITRASKTLYEATYRRAYFHRVKILIPKSWTNTATDDPALKENFQDSEIRVVSSSKKFGYPKVEHPDECGRPGRYIQLAKKFFLRPVTERISSLVKAWATFRWGVFDEHGFHHDPAYPYFYRSRVTERNTINRCTDVPVEGDITCPDRKSPKRKTKELEEKECYLNELPTKNLTSSLMSVTFTTATLATRKKLKFFCDARSHNKEAPTKHNKLCKQRSVWTVMNEHPDFAGGANPTTSTFTDPQFKVIREEVPNYAFVLDFSGSMDDYDRATKLKTIAKNWLLYQVADGSSVAVIRFSKEAEKVCDLTQISDEVSRNAVANSLDQLTPIGGTSIGAGLQMAVEILSGKGNKVIFLVTDGEENEGPKIADVRGNVTSSNARVVTVAFSESADDKLETLAKDTNGKTFFVKDADPINKLGYAFEGALTYQPTPLTSEIRVVIHEPAPFTGTETEIGDSFRVDSNLGRNLEFRLGSDTARHVTADPQLISPSQTVLIPTLYDRSLLIWYIKVDEAEAGEWQWKVSLSGIAGRNVEVQVSCQSLNADVPPIITEAMMDVVPKTTSNTVHDLLKVTAKVTQGTYPVIRANVSAYLTPPGDTKPQIIILKDDGVGADSTKDDGKYSQFLTQYNGVGRYSLKAQVIGTNETQVIGGDFLTQRRKRQATDIEEESEEISEYCCGSVERFDPDEAVKTGMFTRITSGESKMLNNPPPADVDVMAPDKVYDLLVTTTDPWHPSHRLANVSLSWTAPGDDFSVGTVSEYQLWMSANRSEVSETDFEPDPDGGMQGIAINTSGVELGEAGTKITFSTSVPLSSDYHRLYYFVLRATDDAGLISPWSNSAILELQEPADDEAMPTWAIVVVVLVVTFSLAVVLFFLIRSQICQSYIVNARSSHAAVPMSAVA